MIMRRRKIFMKGIWVLLHLNDNFINDILENICCFYNNLFYLLRNKICENLSISLVLTQLLKLEEIGFDSSIYSVRENDVESPMQQYPEGWDLIIRSFFEDNWHPIDLSHMYTPSFFFFSFLLYLALPPLWNIVDLFRLKIP